MKLAIAQGIISSHSYLQYRTIVTEVLSQGKTTGDVQSEDLVHYTQLNEARMNRLDKKLSITEKNIQKLLSLKNEYTWLVISEGWCGDAAQILPVLNKLSSFSQHVELRIVFRDENEALMNLFLSNGNRAIPKLIVIDKETDEVLGNWGPRPKGAANLITSYKQQYGVVDETAKTELQLWYLHDKGVSTQNEVVELMMQCEQLNQQTL